MIVFQKGDIIYLLGMVDSRWCRGILNNQIGTFRSTDVEPVGEDGARLITPRHMRPNKGRRQQRRPKPKTIEELLHRLGLQVLFAQNNPLEIIPPQSIRQHSNFLLLLHTVSKAVERGEEGQFSQAPGK